MRAVMMATVTMATVMALAGCAIPAEKHDTRQDPLFCNGQALPTTADPEVTISGRVVDAFSQDPVGNVPVEGHLLIPPDTDSTVFGVIADGSGQFSKDQQTIGVPREAYLRATPDGYLETRYYPAVPVAHDFETNIQVVTMANLATIAALGGITIDLTKANLLVSAVDCNEHLIGGVTVTTSPAGTELYFANGRPSTSATMTDTVTGTALIANAPTGTMTITATLATPTGTVTLRPHQITATAGVITQTEIQP